MAWTDSETPPSEGEILGEILVPKHAADPDMGITLNSVGKLLPWRGGILKLKHVVGLIEGIENENTYT
jgi:hypothetical protein